MFKREVRICPSERSKLPNRINYTHQGWASWGKERRPEIMVYVQTIFELPKHDIADRIHRRLRYWWYNLRAVDTHQTKIDRLKRLIYSRLNAYILPILAWPWGFRQTNSWYAFADNGLCRWSASKNEHGIVDHHRSTFWRNCDLQSASIYSCAMEVRSQIERSNPRPVRINCGPFLNRACAPA